MVRPVPNNSGFFAMFLFPVLVGAVTLVVTHLVLLFTLAR